MTMPDATAILRDRFGYTAFRGHQAEIIDAVAAGRNVLAVMPTGAGKSLCFQIPALMRAGVAIVVSPLISLMQNQVQALRLAGIDAAALNSGTDPGQVADIWGRLRAGRLDLLYVSPERLMMPAMLEAVGRLRVALFAIDEAHCISQWGASFRPDYEALSALGQHFPDVPIIALTATADPATRAEIEHKIFAGGVHTYLGGFDRPNIHLSVEIKDNWKAQLLRFLAARRRGHGPENGIVYCLSRKKTEAVAALLADQGYTAAAYHAGLTDQRRAETLDRFMAEGDLIVAATIAFGMGIDKPDIRFVLHTDVPGSPEAYYQEIGRAGRDGAPAAAHMLYGLQDIALRRAFIDDAASSGDHKRREHQRLGALLAYCEAPACRRWALLAYFGDRPGHEGGCGTCDVCESPRETVDATTAGRKFLSAILRTGEVFGVGHIVDILVGKTTPKITERGHDQLPTFGVGTEFAPQDWKAIARQLTAHDFITVDVAHGSLRVTPRGRLLLQDRETFRYRPDLIRSRKTAPDQPAPDRPAAGDLPPDGARLYAGLKTLRADLARDRSVPAYVIFPDKSLLDMAVQRPTDLTAFAQIHGVGSKKLHDFGAVFTRFIRQAD